MSPEILGAIVRILRESKSVEEAGRRIESFIVWSVDGDSTNRFYDGYFDECVENAIRGGNEEDFEDEYP